MSQKKHLHVLSELSAHPIAHNIEWVDLIPALASIGFLHADTNNTYELTRNGHKLVFEHPRTKALTIEEVLKIRRFLKQSAQPESTDPLLAHSVIVAIDHHNATIVHNPGTDTVSIKKIHADLEKGRILHKTPHHPGFSDNNPVEDPQYMSDVIDVMKKSDHIVILSHGTGSSSAAEILLSVINEQHPEVAQRIIAVQKCDLEALTEAQIIALGISLIEDVSESRDT